MKNLRYNDFLSAPSSDIRNICKTLFENTEITSVSFGRIYRNDHALSFSTTPEKREWYKVNKKYKFARNDISPKEHRLKPGYYLSDKLDYSHPELLLLKKEQQQNFSHYHNIMVMNSTSEYNESFDFGTNNKNSSINEWYLSNTDVLEKFISYFKSKIAIFLQTPEKFWIPPPDDFDQGMGAIRYHNDQALILDKDRIKTDVEHCYAMLTPREKECLYWLFYGKTMPEIALILNISKRTVEKFITNIKEKFDCNTLFQLGNALSSMQNKLILMESFTKH
jgi:hypothetical protein